MTSTANAASVGQIRSGLRALGESLRRGRRKVCPVLGLIEIETASKSLFSLSVQNVSVCAKSNVGTLVISFIYQHIEGLQGIEWAILGGHSGGSMQVST